MSNRLISVTYDLPHEKWTPEHWNWEFEEALAYLHLVTRHASDWHDKLIMEFKDAVSGHAERFRFGELFKRHKNEIIRHLALSFNPSAIGESAENIPYVERANLRFLNKITEMKNNPLGMLRRMTNLHQGDGEENARVLVDPTLSFTPQYVDRTRIAAQIRETFELGGETVPEAKFDKNLFLLRELGKAVNFMETPPQETPDGRKMFERRDFHLALRTALKIHGDLEEGAAYTQADIDARWDKTLPAVYAAPGLS